jgi:DNA-binding NarL/FixJ family response regulator
MSSASNNDTALRQMRNLVLVDVPRNLASRLPRMVVDAAEIVLSANIEKIPEILASERPDMVISPLIGPKFDAIELAVQLRKAAFKGRLVVICDKLPDPSLIRQELENQALGFTISLLDLGDKDR